MSVADDVNGLYLQMLAEDFTVLTGGDQKPQVNVGAGYHTYKMEMPAGGTDVSIFVDGSSTAAATYTTSGTSPPQGIS